MKTLIKSCFTFLIFSLIACKETEAGSIFVESTEVSLHAIKLKIKKVKKLFAKTFIFILLLDY